MTTTATTTPTTAPTERRRNAKPEGCRACGKYCEAGRGYLYRDTNTHRRNRYTGRFLWFVKCEECHAGEKTRMTVAMEKHAATHASDPVIRPWSVSQVRTWAVDRIMRDGKPAILVQWCVHGEIISCRDRINSRFTAPTGYTLEQMEFGGKPFSEKAAADLSCRILVIVNAVQREEQASGEAALAKLLDAGATAVLCPSGYGWRVEFRGGRYTLWGCVDGKNKMAGFTQPNDQGRWIETTAEALVQ